MNLKDKGLILRKNILINSATFSLIFWGFFCFSSTKLYAADYCKLSNKIVKTFVKEFAEPNGLFLASSGGAMMNGIEKFILNFLSFHVMTIDEARILYVEMIEEFISRVNQNEKIRPYLHNYPFHLENFDLMIGFENSKRQIISDGNVALVLIGKNNMLCFAAYDTTTRFYTLHEEPYEESVRIVHESREAKKS